MKQGKQDYTKAERIATICLLATDRNAGELAKMFGVSRQTIYRDMALIGRVEFALKDIQTKTNL